VLQRELLLRAPCGEQLGGRLRESLKKIGRLASGLEPLALRRVAVLEGVFLVRAAFAEFGEP
jgi:hypothetical protein